MVDGKRRKTDVTTDRKLVANRRNALRSTGPRTAEGKRRASQNARTHGLLAKELVVDGEDAAALDALAGSIRDALLPEGELEAALVDRIVAALWRLRRCGRVETAIFAQDLEWLPETSRELDLGLPFIRASDAFSKLSRYETAIERTLYRALHELERLQEKRKGLAVPPPLARDVTIRGETATGS